MSAVVYGTHVVYGVASLFDSRLERLSCAAAAADTAAATVCDQSVSFSFFDWRTCAVQGKTTAALCQTDVAVLVYVTGAE